MRLERTVEKLNYN